MSYGGLLSYLYAKVDRSDPRVVAVLDWLRANYTIAENPGMDQQGSTEAAAESSRGLIGTAGIDWAPWAARSPGLSDSIPACTAGGGV